MPVYTAHSSSTKRFFLWASEARCWTSNENLDLISIWNQLAPNKIKFPNLLQLYLFWQRAEIAALLRRLRTDG